MFVKGGTRRVVGFQKGRACDRRSKPHHPHNRQARRYINGNRPTCPRRLSGVDVVAGGRVVPKHRLIDDHLRSVGKMHMAKRAGDISRPQALFQLTRPTTQLPSTKSWIKRGTYGLAGDAVSNGGHVAGRSVKGHLQSFVFKHNVLDGCRGFPTAAAAPPTTGPVATPARSRATLE